MKLVHKSGSIKCSPDFTASYWGCAGYGNNGLMTIITDAKKEAVLPPPGELKTHDGSEIDNHFYFLNGTTHTSPELVFPDLFNKVSVSRNQEL